MARRTAPTSRRASRKDKRGRRGKCPHEVAQAELAAGAISAAQFANRLKDICRRECSETWADDVWRGFDRDYSAERAERHKMIKAADARLAETVAAHVNGRATARDVTRAADAAAAARDAVRAEIRVYTGSGTGKVACDSCGHLIPPQNCQGGRCDDCKLEGASEFFLHHLPGTSGPRLRGEG